MATPSDSAQSLLEDPPSGAHVLHVYESEDVLGEVVARFVEPALRSAGRALVIATPAHAAHIRDRLVARGVDVEASAARGELVVLDAAETLATFMRDGAPDPAAFVASVGARVAELTAGAHALRAYGEMVDLLWADGNAAAALALEELWNELGRRHAFVLLCSYALGRFHGGEGRHGIADACRAHSHVVDALGIEVGGDASQLRVAAARARALEAEIRHRTAVEDRLLEALREVDRARAVSHDFLEHAPVPMHSVAGDGTILWANAAEAELLGWPPGALAGRHVADVYEDPAVAEAMLRRLAAGETLRGEPARLRARDGSIRHVLVDSSPHIEHGALARTRCVLRDVTAQRSAGEIVRRAERAVLERLESVQAVTSALSRARTPAEVASTIVEIGGRILGAETALVWRLEPDGSLRLLDARGHSEADVARWARLPAGTPLPAFRILETGHPMWIESEEEYRAAAPSVYDRLRPTGQLRAFAALPLAIGGENRGVITFGFALGHRFADDERTLVLTLARQCEQALERAALYEAEAAARARAEDASRAKDEFLAMLGHELRNPLAPIVTALEIVRRRSGAPSREHEVIERQVRHLGRLVDDLLDVSRITRGKIALRTEPVALADAVAKALEIASTAIEQRGHRVTVEVPHDLHGRLDPVRIAQVVANLLTNAAKYTEPGGSISVAGRREGGDLVLVVEDDGIGIDRDLLPRVFEPFVQGERGIDRAQGGLGIGLSLVKSLVTLHGGSVEARSDGPGRGTSVTVRLPAIDEVPARVAPPRSSGAKTAPRRVLLVDDHADAAEMLAEVLRGSGHEVSVAHDGPSALALAEHGAPELAILDIGLPVMDGHELAVRLRERFAGTPLRLLALTGYGQDSDRERTRRAGFDAHLVKPVDLDALLAWIDG